MLSLKCKAKNKLQTAQRMIKIGFKYFMEI